MPKMSQKTLVLILLFLVVASVAVLCGRAVIQASQPAPNYIGADYWKNPALDDVSVDLSVVEARFRNELTITKRLDWLTKYVFVFSFDYDYAVLDDSITEQEINAWIASCFEAFAEIFDHTSLADLLAEDGIINVLKRCKQYVADQQDQRLYFGFYLSGLIAPDGLKPGFTIDDFSYGEETMDYRYF